MQEPMADLSVLEPGQSTSAARRHFPRRVLNRVELALLIVLRIYVFLALPLVVYAFVKALYAS